MSDELYFDTDYHLSLHSALYHGIPCVCFSPLGKFASIKREIIAEEECPRDGFEEFSSATVLNSKGERVNVKLVHQKTEKAAVVYIKAEDLILVIIRYVMDILDPTNLRFLADESYPRVKLLRDLDSDRLLPSHDSTSVFETIGVLENKISCKILPNNYFEMVLDYKNGFEDGYISYSNMANLVRFILDVLKAKYPKHYSLAYKYLSKLREDVNQELASQNNNRHSKLDKKVYRPGVVGYVIEDMMKDFMFKVALFLAIAAVITIVFAIVDLSPVYLKKY